LTLDRCRAVSSDCIHRGRMFSSLIIAYLTAITTGLLLVFLLHLYEDKG
jgi:hypothetical protein